MKKSCLILMLLLLVVSSISPMAAAQSQQQLSESNSSSNNQQISVQQYTKNGTSVWKLQKGTRLYLLQDGDSTVDPALTSVVKLVDSELAAKGLPSAEPLPIQTGGASLAEAGDIIIRLGQLSETSNSEAYKLEIADQIKLTAPTVRGILYGLRTIEQQLLVSGGLQYGTIIDYPTLPERSYHIDMARKFYTKDWLIQQVKESSWLKINTLELHFSENEGFRLESKVHPEVMSPEYITQAEMKDVLAVAKQYQVDIIPSFDSPGHLQYLLRNHPEWKLKDSSGNACSDTEVCKGALDITNSDAKAYVLDLLDEYAALFKDSKYFNIGGDEFIDFNHFERFPQLQNYARNVLGIANGTGIDTFIDYTNQVAEHMEKKGFIVRVWNDGYFRYDQTEHVQLKKSIQIDYWTKWDSNMAPVQKFIDEGFKLVNFNDAYFYYVLGENAGYKYPTGSKIYDGWHPGLFPNISSSVKQEYMPPYPAAILGASFAIWSDTPSAQTQDQVSAGVYEPLRAMAEKSWIGEKRYSDYAAFKSVFDKIGQVPGYDSDLPTASDIIAANSVGVVYIHAVDDAGQTLYNSRMFGTLGSAYTLTPDTLYGYSLEAIPANAKGTFSAQSTTIHLVYDLKTDKSALQQAYDQSAAYPAADYIAVSYMPYAQQLQQAKTILDNTRATQTTIDNALSSVQQAKSQLIAMSKMQLYVLIKYPQAQNGATSSSYATYLAAIEQAKPLLTDATASAQVVDAAVSQIMTAMKNVKSLGFTTTMYDESNNNQSVDFSQAFDGNSSTYALNWMPQQNGDTIVFNFDKPVNLANFKIQYYPGFNYGRITQANFQVAQLVGGSLQWKTVGTLDNSAETTTLPINENDVQQARIVYTNDTPNSDGTLITEMSFSYNPRADDSGIQQLQSVDTELNSIHLQWEPVSGASSYLVYVNDDAQPSYTGSDPSFVHSHLQPNTVYTYRVMYVSGGVTSIPYFIQVKTPELIDTKLSALAIDKGQLSPNFDPSITSYTTNVASDVYKLDLTLVKHHPLQQLTVTGAVYGRSVTADSYSYQIDITQPQQSVTIEVYSPNGTSPTSTYTLQIARSAAPWFSTRLTGLTLADGSLTPAFSPSTLNYSATVASSVYRTTVTANVYDASATLTINGQSAVSGQAQSINLNSGDNVIPIKVQARNGQTQTYTLTVKRQSSSDGGSGSGSSGNSNSSSGNSSNSSSGNSNSSSGSSGNSSSGSTANPDVPIISSNGRLTLDSSQSGQVRVDNILSLSIPADASDSTLVVTMKVLNASEQPSTQGAVLLSPVYELLKNMPSNFNHPVTLQFTFDPAQIGANETAAVFYYGESSQRWIEVGGTIKGNEITAEVNHFTKFAVMAVSKTSDVPVTAPTTTSPANSVSFSDIDSSWAAANIKRAVALGIVKGYSDGTFLPNKSVTRAEFVVMLAHALQLPTSDTTLHFQDQAQIGTWAEPAIRAAIDAKIIKGYPDNHFRPNAIITRAEMATILAAAMKSSEPNTTVSHFADETRIPTWAKGAVQALQQTGVIQGRTGNQFMPQASATRAESITIILNMLAATNAAK